MKLFQDLKVIAAAKRRLAFTFLFFPDHVDPLTGKQIIVNDDLVTVATGVYEIPCGIVWSTGHIVINNAANATSPNVRSAIIAHEFGHIVHGHHKVSSKKDFFLRLLGNKKQMQWELDADAYAASLGCKEGLVEWLELAQKVLGPKRETRLRLAALKSM
jgi:hypothetical protein